MKTLITPAAASRLRLLTARFNKDDGMLSLQKRRVIIMFGWFSAPRIASLEDKMEYDSGIIFETPGDYGKKLAALYSMFEGIANQSEFHPPFVPKAKLARSGFLSDEQRKSFNDWFEQHKSNWSSLQVSELEKYSAESTDSDSSEEGRELKVFLEYHVTVTTISCLNEATGNSASDCVSAGRLNVKIPTDKGVLSYEIELGSLSNKAELQEHLKKECGEGSAARSCVLI